MCGAARTATCTSAVSAVTPFACLPGKDNHFADGLSRRPDLLSLRAIAALAPYDPWLTRVQKGLHQDPEAEKLNASASALQGKLPNYKRAHGVLYYTARGVCRVYVPDVGGLRT